MYPATIVLMCCALCTCGVATDSESMEMQTKFLTGIYESVKDRQLEEGELNLLPNQSMGFANTIRSFSEKGKLVRNACIVAQYVRLKWPAIDS